MHKNFKFLHISDIHLGTYFLKDTIIGKDSDERRQELWVTFQRTLDFAREENAEFVLIAGDLFENSSFTISNLDRLAYIFHQFSDLEFYIVAGNHDYISPKFNYLKDISGDNVHFFDAKLDFYEISKLNVRIYGFSWDRLEINEIPFDFPKLDGTFYNVLLLHTNFQKPSNYLPLSLSNLENVNFNYFAFGHIHYHHEVYKNAYYSGSPEPLKFTNTGPHGALIVSYENSLLSVEFKEFGVRQYREYELDLNGISNNLEAFKAAELLLTNAKNGDYIRITGKNQKVSVVNLNELEEKLRESFKYLEIIDKTLPSIDIDEIFESNTSNLVGEYIEFVKENYDDVTAAKLLDICIKGFITGDLL